MSGLDNIVAFPDRSSIEEEAARWVLRHEEGELTAREQEAFDSWRRTSPAHQETFDALFRHWGDLDAMTREPSPARMRDERSPGPWRRPAMAALAAGFVVAAAIATLIFVSAPSAPPAADATAANVFATKVGDLRVVKLADGSTVTLNTDSRLEVAFTDRERRVTLYSGEAFFEVAHDTSRPFRVYAPGGVTTAVGTAFSVRVMDEGVNVVVSSGKVPLQNRKQTSNPSPSSRQDSPRPSTTSGNSSKQFPMTRSIANCRGPKGAWSSAALRCQTS